MAAANGNLMRGNWEREAALTDLDPIGYVEESWIQICWPKAVVNGNGLNPTFGKEVPMTWGFKNIYILHVYMKSYSVVKLHRKQPRSFDTTNIG